MQRNYFDHRSKYSFFRFDMWWTSVKATVTALYRDKAYASINIIGLSIGMACCLILGLYLFGQLTYDQHHNNHDRIYRIAVEYTIDGRSDTFALSSPLLGPTLAKDYAEMQTFVRFRHLSTSGRDDLRLIRHEDKAFYWRDAYMADNTVFEIFTHNILYGDQETALISPHSAAVSRTFAEKYFGDTNPIGKAVILESGEQKAITLVFEDLPQNTHLKYDILFPYPLQELYDDPRSYWSSVDFTYVLLPSNYATSSFKTFTEDIFARYMSDHGTYLNGTWKAWLEPLSEIHLYSDVGWDRPTGNRFYLYGISAVGAFILLIACINYLNLSTARATKRANEIGMRKILGASQLSLGLQFLAESVLVSMIALVIAIALFKAALAFTPIGGLIGYSLTSELNEAPAAYAWIVGSSLVIGILAGLYPAYYLSSIVPLAALVGARSGTKGNRQIRELLVLLQFAISVGVIASTIIMNAQMQYLANQPLGFEKEGRLAITLHGVDLIEKLPVISEELRKHEHVIGVTGTDRLMGLPGHSTFFETESNEGETVSVTTQLMPVADNFLEVMGIEIIDGRNFSPAESPDGVIIVNEAVVRRMSWHQPLGKRMGLADRSVIGVVRDFNFDSLHKAVEPMAIHQYRTNFANMPIEFRPFAERYLIVNISMSDFGKTINNIEETVQRFDTVHPFQYQFIDSVLNRLYLSEDRLLKLIAIFSAISIFIACLGQFGLMAYTTAERTKEIGIRKVLGASTLQIILLLYRRVVALALIGAVIATITTFGAMDVWLSTFAHRINVSPYAFLMATAIVIGVSAITIALQSYDVAREDPIHALRFE